MPSQISETFSLSSLHLRVWICIIRLVYYPGEVGVEKVKPQEIFHPIPPVIPFFPFFLRAGQRQVTASVPSAEVCIQWPVRHLYAG